MGRPVYVVFVAGGSGTRMGTDVPKQFLDLGGMPVLMRTIYRFADAVPDMHAVTVLPRQHVGTWKELCVDHDFSIPQKIAVGGLTRFHSVLNALEKVPDGAIVAIHDGVRPFPSVEMLRSMFERMQAGAADRSCRALVPSTPVVDTLRSVDPDLPTPSRASLVAVQTPQIFLSEELRAAYRQPYDTSFTDDASVAERAGIPVTLCKGERTNIKITCPEDLLLAKGLL